MLALRNTFSAMIAERTGAAAFAAGRPCLDERAALAVSVLCSFSIMTVFCFSALASKRTPAVVIRPVPSARRGRTPCPN